MCASVEEIFQDFSFWKILSVFICEKSMICCEPGVREQESAQRAVAREDGMTRQNENNQQQSRRNAPGVQEHEAAQQLAARDEPGV